MRRLRPFPGFASGTYISQSPSVDNQLSMNWFKEVSDSEHAKSPEALYPTPGLDLFSSPDLGKCRASFSQDGRCFYVLGFSLVEIFDDGSFTNHGTMASDPPNPATISSSGDISNELFITSGGEGYIFNLLTDTLSPAIPGLTVHFGGYLDGRFLALNTDDSSLRISDFADGTTWNALNVRFRAGAGDKWASMVVTSRNIFLIGTQTYEVWWSSGAPVFPFEPIPNVLYQQGILAPYSARRVGDYVIWLSQNENGKGVVVLAAQYDASRISNFGMDFKIQHYVTPEDAISMVYQRAGHTFYVLTFLDDDETWCWDLATREWHNRGFWQNDGVTPAHYEAWRPLFYANAFGKDLVGDRSNGQIYEMSDENWLDVGEVEIRRVRRTPHIASAREWMTYFLLRLDVQQGVGTLTGQGENPKIMLRLSDDGGLTWGNELHASVGRRAKNAYVTEWARLGRSRDRVFEISTSDPVAWRIGAAYLDVGS